MKSDYFSGEITHTEETIFRLFRAQYHTFCKRQMLLRLLAGLAFVAIAVVLAIPMWIKTVILVIGAWLLMSLDFPSQIKADKTLVERRALLPVMKYEFFPKDMKISGEGSMRMDYKKLINLVVDTEYLYLFSSPETVCMIERATVRESDEKLMEFLAEKTGLEWKRDKSFFLLNFYELGHIFLDRYQKKIFLKK